MDLNLLDFIKKLITKNYSLHYIFNLILITKPKLIREISKIIEHHFKDIDFSKLDEIKEIFRKSEIFGYYNTPNLEYSTEFLNKKLNEILSNPLFSEAFNPASSIFLARNFSRLNKDLQEKLFSLLVEHKRLTCIEYWLEWQFNRFPRINV